MHKYFSRLLLLAVIAWQRNDADCASLKTVDNNQYDVTRLGEALQEILKLQKFKEISPVNNNLETQEQTLDGAPYGSSMKRQMWSQGFSPGGKRSFSQENMPLAQRQMWSVGFSPGGKRSFDGKKIDSKRQMWSQGFSPGGKREYQPKSFFKQGDEMDVADGMLQQMLLHYYTKE